MSQSALDGLGRGTYLEIGVNTGDSFIPILAKRKWAVDPGPKMSWKRLSKYMVFSALGIKGEKVFPLTSDAFFAAKSKMLATHGVDVCLVDGLHTYEQALRDVLNAARYLKPNGVILMHDCNPSTELRGIPAESIEVLIEKSIPGWDGAWNGDVWKAVVHLRSLHHDLNAFVVDCDNGVGVVTRGDAAAPLSYSEAEIRQMDYHVLAARRTELLDLKPPEYFPDFLRAHLSRTKTR